MISVFYNVQEVFNTKTALAVLVTNKQQIRDNLDIFSISVPCRRSKGDHKITNSKVCDSKTNIVQRILLQPWVKSSGLRMIQKDVTVNINGLQLPAESTTILALSLSLQSI